MTATSMETKQRPWGLTLIMGIAAFILGAILLWAPAKAKVETYQILVSLIGIYWLIAGIIDVRAPVTQTARPGCTGSVRPLDPARPLGGQEGRRAQKRLADGRFRALFHPA